MTNPRPLPMRVTRPGDHDLDCEIHDLVICAVIRHCNEFIISLTGGSGWWRDADTGDAVRVNQVNTGTYACGYSPTTPESTLRAVEQRLTDWRDAQSKLSLVSAPGRATTLLDARARCLPLPRTQSTIADDG